MTPIQTATIAIEKALELLPARMDSKPAKVLMVAIGLQESRLVHRRQIGGPARGLWQFEQGGGVLGVLRHKATSDLARALCVARGVGATMIEAYSSLEADDVLAAGFARLLLWTDPKPLPRIGDEAGAWDYYIRNWRPGRPHLHTWQGLYRQAVEAF